MGKHLTPQAYLRAFSSTRPGHVHVYDKEECRWRSDGPLPTSRVAQRADVWSDQVERRITPDEADGLASLSKLSRREDITWQEREAAAFYLAHMVAFRSDRAWSEMSPLAEQAVQAKRTQAAEGLLSDRYSKWLDRELREIRRGPQKGNSDLRSDLVEGASKPTMHVLLHTRWTVLHASRGRFVTCDTPVWFTNSIGIGSTCSHVWSPLSPSVLLLADWGAYGAGEIRHQETREVSKFNRLIVGSAHREIYASERFAWIPRLVERMKEPEALVRAERQLAARMGPVERRKTVTCASCGLELLKCGCPWDLPISPGGSVKRNRM